MYSVKDRKKRKPKYYLFNISSHCWHCIIVVIPVIQESAVYPVISIDVGGRLEWRVSIPLAAAEDCEHLEFPSLATEEQRSVLTKGVCRSVLSPHNGTVLTASLD